MGNTYCKGCVFSSPTDALTYDYSENSHCKFDIPKYIKNIKTITVKDQYYYIENYICKYAFSENVLQQNANLDAKEIENIIIEKAKLKYYLIINIIGNKCSSSLLDMIISVNQLDIKPNMISVLIDTSLDKKEIFDTIQQNLDKKIKWKIHTFVDSIPLNDRFNIAAETTIQNSESSNIFLYDLAAKTTSISLNDMVNHVHYTRNVEQRVSYGFIEKPDNLSGLCLPISLYKSIITNIDRDIIKGINMVEEIKLDRYEIEKST
jgi:hypothetical protein